jgi:hypothetical protein
MWCERSYFAALKVWSWPGRMRVSARVAASRPGAALVLQKSCAIGFRVKGLGFYFSQRVILFAKKMPPRVEIEEHVLTTHV